MSYQNVKAWKDSRVLTKRIYEITAGFPSDEKYGLAAQVRRAAVSIISNIAEAQGRWSLRDQCRFYYVARGSLLETETQLMISADLGFVRTETLNEILERTAEIGRELNGLIRSNMNRMRRN